LGLAKLQQMDEDWTGHENLPAMFDYGRVSGLDNPYLNCNYTIYTNGDIPYIYITYIYI